MAAKPASPASGRWSWLFGGWSPKTKPKKAPTRDAPGVDEDDEEFYTFDAYHEARASPQTLRKRRSQQPVSNPCALVAASARPRALTPVSEVLVRESDVREHGPREVREVHAERLEGERPRAEPEQRQGAGADVRADVDEEARGLVRGLAPERHERVALPPAAVARDDVGDEVARARGPDALAKLSDAGVGHVHPAAGRAARRRRRDRRAAGPRVHRSVGAAGPDVARDARVAGAGEAAPRRRRRRRRRRRGRCRRAAP